MDDAFIRKCLDSIEFDAEFLVVETVPRTAGQQSWFHHEAGESHGELQETLEGLRGRHVAVGAYPPWQADSQDVLSAYVPKPDGRVTAGSY